jgi:hypothetical protein
MKYQVAELFTGPFGKTYDTLEEAKKALIREVEECRKYEERWDKWQTDDENDFCIVEVKEIAE